MFYGYKKNKKKIFLFCFFYNLKTYFIFKLILEIVMNNKDLRKYISSYLPKKNKDSDIFCCVWAKKNYLVIIKLMKNIINVLFNFKL